MSWIAKINLVASQENISRREARWRLYQKKNAARRGMIDDGRGHYQRKSRAERNGYYRGGGIWGW